MMFPTNIETILIEYFVTLKSEFPIPRLALFFVKEATYIG